MSDRLKVNFGDDKYPILMDKVGKWIIRTKDLVIVHSMIVTPCKKVGIYNCIIWYSYN